MCEVLPWPSLSPDLNPIEHLCGMLVRSAGKDYGSYDYVKSLLNAIAKTEKNSGKPNCCA